MIWKFNKPKEEGLYIVTLLIDNEEIIVDTSMFWVTENEEECNYWEAEHDADFKKVIAWTYLPEPVEIEVNFKED